MGSLFHSFRLDRGAVQLPFLVPAIANRRQQIRGDLATFQELGCAWVLLDTYHDYLVHELASPETAWAMFEAVAHDIFDLQTERVRPS